MDDDSLRRGTRDNGLRCAGYVAVADLDPRVADALLGVLRDNGIAAYAGPTPGTTGGYMETRLPDRPIDRLWVDEAQRDRAKVIVDDETASHRAEEAEALDFEQAWRQVLTSLQSSPSGSGPAAWPASEDAEPLAPMSSHVVRSAEVDPHADADDDPFDRDPFAGDNEHFVPPPPPPLPRLRPPTLAALIAIAGGLVILGFDVADGSLWPLAVLAILGGLASLVWHMRQGPPTDSGWDDGAVV